MRNYTLKKTDFRVGNLCWVKYSDEKEPSKVFLNEKQLSDILDNRGLEIIAPVILTEDIMKQLRRVVRDDFSMIEFRCYPPGERQLSNNWYSSGIHEFARLHLSPSFKDHRNQTEDPEFWFIWIYEFGTGGSSYLPLINIHSSHTLRYVHQLQNLFQILTGLELTYVLTNVQK